MGFSIFQPRLIKRKVRKLYQNYLRCQGLFCKLFLFLLPSQVLNPKLVVHWFCPGKVLLLDEPTSALDPISTQNIEEAIVRLKKTRGLTTVMVSHSVKQIQRIADLVCLLVAGEVVEVLHPANLSHAQHPMARRFLELS